MLKKTDLIAVGQTPIEAFQTIQDLIESYPGWRVHYAVYSIGKEKKPYWHMNAALGDGPVIMDIEYSFRDNMNEWEVFADRQKERFITKVGLLTKIDDVCSKDYSYVSENV